MTKKKCVLVNPPGKHRYLRDYYSASIAKTDYYYPPVDLIWLSAVVKMPLKIYDAIAEGAKPPDVAEKIASSAPDFIFCLVSGLSMEEDIDFIRMLKNKTSARIIAMGDVCHISAGQLLRDNPELDAVLKSFSCVNVSGVMEGDFPPRLPVPGWAFRAGNVILEEDEKTASRSIKIGIPKWEEFPLKAYKFPFALKRPVATVLTDYGCPFRCHYCSIGALEWRVRDIDEVIGELKLLTALGIREIHFRDQTFGIDKDRTLEMMTHLKEGRFTWSCFSRVDIATEEMVSLMKDSGCHTIIFGIESGNHAFREKYGKGIGDDEILKVLNRCSKARINTVGTFIIGLPEETEEAAQKTIEFAKSLPLDYASFNIATPRLGSQLQDRSGFMPYEKALELASSGSRQFYVRLPYILNKLSKIRSLSAFISEVRMGCNLIFGSRQ